MIRVVLLSLLLIGCEDLKPVEDITPRIITAIKFCACENKKLHTVRIRARSMSIVCVGDSDWRILYPGDKVYCSDKIHEEACR